MSDEQQDKDYAVVNVTLQREIVKGFQSQLAAKDILLAEQAAVIERARKALVNAKHALAHINMVIGDDKCRIANLKIQLRDQFKLTLAAQEIIEIVLDASFPAPKPEQEKS